MSPRLPKTLLMVTLGRSAVYCALRSPTILPGGRFSAVVIQNSMVTGAGEGAGAASWVAQAARRAGVVAASAPVRTRRVRRVLNARLAGLAGGTSANISGASYDGRWQPSRWRKGWRSERTDRGA